jgi:hypothetical protein
MKLRRFVPAVATLIAMLASLVFGNTGPVRTALGLTLTGAIPQTGTAVLSVTSGLPAQAGTNNALAGKTFVLFKESFAGFLRRTGKFQGPPGSVRVAPLAAWLYACQTQSPVCQQALYEARPNAVGEAKADLNGKATLPGVPAGTYYLFAIAPYNKQALVWDLRVDLKPGANSVTLDQRNVAPLDADSPSARSTAGGSDAGADSRPCVVTERTRANNPGGRANSTLSVIGMGYTYTYTRTDGKTGAVTELLKESGNFSNTTLYLLDDDALNILQRAGIGAGLLGSPYATMAFVDSGTQVADFPGISAIASIFGNSEMLAEFKQMAQADYDCAMNAVRAHSVAETTTDTNARATFPVVPAGTYYLFGRFYRLQKPVRAGGMFWNMKINVKPGQNVIRLSVENAAWKTGS